MPSKLVPENAIVCAGRVFVALRKSGRSSPGRTVVFHAVTPHCRMSLCADEPGARSGWAEPPANNVTCRTCLRRLRRLAGPGVEARERPTSARSGISPGCSVQLPTDRGTSCRVLAFSEVRVDERYLLPIIRLPREKKEAVGPLATPLSPPRVAGRAQPLRR